MILRWGIKVDQDSATVNTCLPLNLDQSLVGTFFSNK